MTEVVAALIWREGRFLACQRPAHKARGLLWEFAGGKVEPGETRRQALVRECREELGITVEEACIEYASLYAAPADYPRLLEQFGLGTLRKNFVSKLSGGERQTLSVVLALIGNPEIVFLDELTTGLDVVARREVWRTLKQLESQGLTIFLTTHYMEEAEALCDRVCIIKSGKKVAEGTIDEVIAVSGQNDLEDAYLFFMGEEELL